MIAVRFSVKSRPESRGMPKVRKYPWEHYAYPDWALRHRQRSAVRRA